MSPLAALLTGLVVGLVAIGALLVWALCVADREAVVRERRHQEQLAGIAVARASERSLHAAALAEDRAERRELLLLLREPVAGPGFVMAAADVALQPGVDAEEPKAWRSEDDEIREDLATAALEQLRDRGIDLGALG